MSSTHDTTQTLCELAQGKADAAEKLFPVVYAELCALAERYMRRERVDHTLEATALVHEAYMRLIDQRRVDWKGKTHFMAVSAEMIRRILVDHARRRAAAKRGGDHLRLTLDEALAAIEPEREIELMSLDDALQELARLSERQARIVELRFFAGLSVRECAEVLGVSERTIKGDWRVARAWLRNRLGNDL